MFLTFLEVPSESNVVLTIMNPHTQAAHELQVLLDELKMTEAQLSSAANPDSDRFEALIKWLRDGGAKVRVQTSTLYLQRIRSGSVYVSVE